MESIQKLDDLKGALTDLKAHLHWNQHTEVPGRSPGKGLKRPVKSRKHDDGHRKAK